MSLKILFEKNDEVEKLRYKEMQSISTSNIFDLDIYLHQLKKANELPKENLEISNREFEIVTSQKYDSLNPIEKKTQDTLNADSPKILPDNFTRVPLYDQILSNTTLYQETPNVEFPKEISKKVEATTSQTLEENLFSQLATSISTSMSFENSGLERRVFSYTPWHIREPPKQSPSYYSTTSQRMPVLNYYRR